MSAPARPRRLLSIAHSYVVAQNRRLAHEMARQSGGRWEVTAVAPSFFHGDLRPIPIEPFPEEQNGLEAVPVHLSRSLPLFVYGRRLAELLDRSWDMIHCWEEPYVLSAAQVGLWARAGTPLVYTTAQNLSKRYPPPFAWTERLAMRRASGWIAMGHTVARTLQGRPGYQGKPCRVIPLGVDTDRFRPDAAAREETRRRLGLASSGPPVVGYLGRFVPEKGLTLLMRALEELETPWRALFVGGGPLERELSRWAAARGGDRVRVVTGVAHDEVPRHLNAMDVLCAPSQTTPRWREQFGRMLVEAFACGVPVIASDSGEIPHVVGDAGVIVGERDTDGWRRALAVLLSDPARRRELSERGRERAQALYAWPVVARQTLGFLEERQGAAGAST